MRICRLAGCAMSLMALCLVLGCIPPHPDKDKMSKKETRHEHPTEGPHHGVLVEWGDEEYHPEVTFDHDKQQATVYILDGGAEEFTAIDAKSITMTITNAGSEPITLKLQADPQENDPEGKSSRFTGTHKILAKEKEFKGFLRGKVGDMPPYEGKFDESKRHKH